MSEKTGAYKIADGMGGIVKFINTVFVDHKVTIFELLLIGLALAEAIQGATTVDHNNTIEASKSARFAGHLALFLVGMVSGLVYAKELKDVAAGVQEKRSAAYIISQILQFGVVLALLVMSIVGQTIIILAIYGQAETFMTMFMENPFSPLWKMISINGFVTLTVYVAYVHFFVLLFIGLKQMSDDEISKDAKSKKAKDKAKTDKEKAKALVDLLKTKGTPEKTDFDVIEKLSSDVQTKLIDYVKSQTNERNAANAVLEFFNLKSDTAVLTTHYPALNKIVGKKA